MVWAKSFAVPSGRTPNGSFVSSRSCGVIKTVIAAANITQLNEGA